jgi:hypothetical protein
MPSRLGSTFLLFALALGCAGHLAAEPAAPAITLRFSGVEYFHRWAKNGQHAFTPQGQDDEDHWADMVTINYYRPITNETALAAKANEVLAGYKKSGAKILRANAVPRTPGKPAEYLLVEAMERPDFIEVAFARFTIVDGVGLSVVYFHREYGSQIGSQLDAWLQRNDPATEKALLGLKDIPLLDVARM